MALRRKAAKKRKAAKRKESPRTEISFRSRQAWNRTIRENLRTRYGLGNPSGAWNHMSADQRVDAVASEVLAIVTQQDPETAAAWTYARAVEMIELMVGDFAASMVR